MYTTLTALLNPWPVRGAQDSNTFGQQPCDATALKRPSPVGYRCGAECYRARTSGGGASSTAGSASVTAERDSFAGVATDNASDGASVLSAVRPPDARGVRGRGARVSALHLLSGHRALAVTRFDVATR